MTESKPTEKKPIVLPCIAAALTILSLFLIGQAGSAFPEMYKDFGIDPLPWNIRFISCFHSYWTLPLSCLVTGVLLWGSRRWTRKRSLIVSGLVACHAVVFFLFFRVHINDAIIPHEVMNWRCRTSAWNLFQEVEYDSLKMVTHALASE